MKQYVTASHPAYYTCLNQSMERLENEASDSRETGERLRTYLSSQMDSIIMDELIRLHMIPSAFIPSNCDAPSHTASAAVSSSSDGAPLRLRARSQLVDDEIWLRQHVSQEVQLHFGTEHALFLSLVDFGVREMLLKFHTRETKTPFVQMNRNAMKEICLMHLRQIIMDKIAQLSEAGELDSDVTQPSSLSSAVQKMLATLANGLHTSEQNLQSALFNESAPMDFELPLLSSSFMEESTTQQLVPHVHAALPTVPVPSQPAISVSSSSSATAVNTSSNALNNVAQSDAAQRRDQQQQEQQQQQQQNTALDQLRAAHTLELTQVRSSHAVEVNQLRDELREKTTAESQLAKEIDALRTEKKAMIIHNEQLVAGHHLSSCVICYSAPADALTGCCKMLRSCEKCMRQALTQHKVCPLGCGRHTTIGKTTFGIKC